MKAYSYLRFSTTEQIKGDSFRRQTEASERYATENGLQLDTSLRMTDLGVSAFDKSNITKGALGGFLRAVEEGKVPLGSCLLVESLDRLSRAEVLDALQQFMAIINAGIVIITLSDNHKYSKSSIGENPMELMFSIMVMMRAHEESDIKSMRVGAAWKKKLQNALDHNTLVSNTVPMWMRVVEGKIQLIPERAEVIRRIFQMFKDGLGQNTITKILNSEVQPWNREKIWHISYIHKLCHNPAVYGAFETNGNLAEGYFPAVLSKDEYDYVASLRSKRRTTSITGTKSGDGVTNLFSGIAHCGYCGAKMVISSSKSIKHQSYSKSLVCYGARLGTTKCKCVRWEVSDIEAYFLFFVSQLDIRSIFRLDNSEQVDILTAQLMRISAVIAEKAKRRLNIYQAIEEEPVPGLALRLKELEAEIVSDNKELHKIEVAILTAKNLETRGSEQMKSLLTYYRNMKTCSQLERRVIREKLYEMIHSITERIELFPTGMSLNLSEKEMRFMRVHFKSGQIREIAAG